MGVDPNGMDRVNQFENQFALVIYIPKLLGRFLDELRRELAPTCVPHAHVSVLPPRPISAPWQVVCKEAQARAGEFAPFEIEATAVNIFPFTEVIYLELGRGTEELRKMHAILSRRRLAFEEPFPFHPHITVAQGLPDERVAQVRDLAVRRWGEYTGPRTFRADRVTFVENTSLDCWKDLAQIMLGAVPVGTSAVRRKLHE